MSDNRISALLKGQSVLAQKVYEFVPEGEPLPKGAIKALLEASGKIGTIEVRKLDACLSALKQANLISEPGGGRFRRRKRMSRNFAEAPIEPTPVAVIQTTTEAPAPWVPPAPMVAEVPAPVIEEPVVEAPAPVVEAPAPVVAEVETSEPVAAEALASELDVFSGLANEVVALGEEFSARLKDLAARIEEAALRREENTEQAEKFKKLQDFMKGL